MKRAFWLLLSGLLFLLGLAFTEHFYSCFSLSNSLSDQLSLIHLQLCTPAFVSRYGQGAHAS